MSKIEPIYKQLGARLRELRKSSGLTQAEAAQLLMMSRPSLSNIEQGNQRLLAHTLADFAYAYDVPLEAIFGTVTDQTVWVSGPTAKHLKKAVTELDKLLNQVASQRHRASVAAARRRHKQDRRRAEKERATQC